MAKRNVKKSVKKVKKVKGDIDTFIGNLPYYYNNDVSGCKCETKCKDCSCVGVSPEVAAENAVTLNRFNEVSEVYESIERVYDELLEDGPFSLDLNIIEENLTIQIAQLKKIQRNIRRTRRSDFVLMRMWRKIVNFIWRK
jgi:hypothetical protein